MDYYDLIFKRKSFHIFKDTEPILEDDLNGLKSYIKTIEPLDKNIKTHIEIVPESETTCRRGAEYCILFFSERKGNYLRNIGYIGEQIDLYLTSNDIGALWFGVGKPNQAAIDDMEFVIMISIAKVSAEKFRKDMFKAKRKPLEEIWSGDRLGIAEIVRFAPSACNTQPWIVENKNGKLLVYRYKKPGKRGIMPADKVRYYNRIDIGIFLFFLETCLKQNEIIFECFQYIENADDSVEKVLVAEYMLKR